MIPTRQLKALIWAVLIAIIIALGIQGKLQGATAGDIIHSYSYVLSSIAILLWCWNHFLWHWWPFYPWFHKQPYIKGTWKGVLQSSYIDPATNDLKPPIEVYLVVRQTYAETDVRVFSFESRSASLSASFVSPNVDEYMLVSTYRNTPSILRRKESPISHGGLLLFVRGAPIHRIEGEYWTDRETKGQILLTGRAKKLADDFQQAQGFIYRSLE
jgi:hypothetical protein